MKQIVLLMLVLICTSSLAFAQVPGSIDIFNDSYPGTLDCNFYDSVPGLMTMNIVHTNGELVASSQWMLEVTAGAEGMAYMGEIPQFPTVIGSSMSGISVAYGACLTQETILLVVVNWFGDGTSTPCGLFSIVADPVAASGGVDVADCDLNRMTIEHGGQARVNPDGTCMCLYDPVEETTWGSIKALYQ